MAAQGDHYDTARILIYRKALVDDVTVVCVLLVKHFSVTLVKHW